MPVDLSDYTEAWLMNADGSLEEPGVIAVNWPDQGGTPSTTGHVEDPASVTLGRGALEPAGGTTNSRWLTRPNSTGDIFDVRGLTSISWAGWFKLDAGNTGEPFYTSIHNPSGADKQAFWCFMSNTFGVNKSPGWGMLDGLSSFNQARVQAADLLIAKGTWQFQGGSWDKDTNVISHFWGRAVGESYYNEDVGHAAGFGYDGTSHWEMGRYTASGGNGTDAKGYADQVMWWKGRALTEADFSFLWNNHVGRALDDLVGATLGGRTIEAALTCRPIVAKNV